MENQANDRKGTTKNSGRKDAFDRFYTDETEASRLLKYVIKNHDNNASDIVFIEPSAGKGSFVLACEEASGHVLAYDIMPDSNPLCQTKIVQCDFLALTKQQLEDDIKNLGYVEDKVDIIFVGNPPFGVQGDLSIQFIEHCHELGGDEVWFILPPTFQKDSYLKKMPHAIIKEVIELKNTLYTLPDSNSIDVPSVFIAFDMVDEKPDCNYDASEYIEKLPFVFLKTSEVKQNTTDADFTIRRVGGNAGKANLNTNVSCQSNYFCKLKDDAGVDVDTIIDNINSIEFVERNWTVGPRSISKGELAKNYLLAFKN